MPIELQEFLSRVSVVVLSFNRKEELERNVPKLIEMAQQYGVELIIVDNASGDGSTEYLRAIQGQFSEITICFNVGNQGVAGGRNSGWEKCTREFIASVDDDTRIDVNALAALIRVLRGNQRIGAVSPKISHAQTGALQCFHGDSRTSISGFHGACHVVRRDVYKQVGPLDPKCTFGGEELDYSIRIRAAGYDVVYSPEAEVRHNNFMREATEDLERRQKWAYNYVRVLFKHFPFSTAMLFASRSTLSHFLSASWAYGPLSAFSIVVATLRGVRDGRSSYSKIPDEVVRRYRDPHFKPDYGNHTIAGKLLRRLNRPGNPGGSVD